MLLGGGKGVHELGGVEGAEEGRKVTEPEAGCLALGVAELMWLYGLIGRSPERGEHTARVFEGATVDRSVPESEGKG